MYRVRSAPANLCMMSHRKKPTANTKITAESPGLLTPSPDEEPKQIVLAEVITDITNDTTLSDPTEQLIVFTIIRFLFKWEQFDLGFKRVLWTLIQRLLASFLSHKFMILTLAFLHSSYTQQMLENGKHVFHTIS